MNRFKAALQVGLALILFVVAAGTLVNMLLITTRPETISVVNTLIGQTLISVCLLALGRILLKRGLARFASERSANDEVATDANRQAQDVGTVDKNP